MASDRTPNVLRYLRLTAHLKQETVARRYCVGAKALDEWEKGVNRPPRDFLILIADLYGISERQDDLLTVFGYVPDAARFEALARLTGCVHTGREKAGKTWA